MRGWPGCASPPPAPDVRSRTAPPRSPHQSCAQAPQPRGGPAVRAARPPQAPLPFTPRQAGAHAPLLGRKLAVVPVTVSPRLEVLPAVLSARSDHPSLRGPREARALSWGCSACEGRGHAGLLAPSCPVAAWNMPAQTRGPPPCSPAGRPPSPTRPGLPPALAAAHPQKSHPSYLPWTHLSWLIFNNVEISL